MSGDSSVLIVHVLPLAAGAAISPALLGASVEILLAFGSRAARMLLRYFLGAAVVVVSASALASILPKRLATTGDGLLTDAVDVVLGAILLALAAVLIFRRPSNRKHGGVKRLLTSRWAGVGVFGLGIVMMATNVSTLVFVLAGAHAAYSAAIGLVARGVGLGLLALGALAPILIPLLWVTLRPASAVRELQRVSALISKRGRMLGIVVCVLTGGYLLVRGFGAL